MTNNRDDIIKSLLNVNGKIGVSGPVSGENDIRKRLETIDKNAAIEKLKKMGLGSVAEKLRNTSDDELIKLIAKNPELLKKINSLLK